MPTLRRLRHHGATAPYRGRPPVRTLDAPILDAATIGRIMRLFDWKVPYADFRGEDARVAGGRSGFPRGSAARPTASTSCARRSIGTRAPISSAASAGRRAVPLILALANRPQGIVVDAALPTADEASIVFGFSWSYFAVDVADPGALVAFLWSLMPLKRVDELYTAVGYHRHGKTEFYRNLMRHLTAPRRPVRVRRG